MICSNLTETLRITVRAQLALALALFSLLSGCGGNDQSKEDASAVAPVQTAKAVQEPIERVISADAVLYPIRQSAITPKISAPVRRFLVNRGDHVREGQLLAELENRDLVAAADESHALYDQAESAYKTTTGGTVPEDTTKARADVESAAQGFEAARRVYENRVALVKEGALAQKLADDAKVALVQAQSQLDIANRHLESLQTVSRAQLIKSAEDQVNAAKAHYTGAQAQVYYSEIRTPIAGIVSDRSAYEGEMATSGSPLITVVDIRQMIARVNVPAIDVTHLKLGQTATVHSAEGDLEGKVWVISPSVDPASTTLEIWIKLDNPKEEFKPGTTARIEIHAETIKDAVVVPDSAILASDEGGDQIVVVSSSSTAEVRKVQIGVRQGPKVQITDGVKPGEEVVTVGGVGLDDKVKVRVENSGHASGDHE